MRDRFERLGHASLIQHGELNQRIYLIKLHRNDLNLIPELNHLAREKGYTKIFCKVPDWAAPAFSADGFIMEAHIPGFYRGTTGACFMSKFLSSDRLLGMETAVLKDFSQLLLESESGDKKAGDSGRWPVQLLAEADAEEIASVYGTVFKSYPFPINDPAYIRQTMKDHIRYFGVRNKGKLIALSSAEMDLAEGNAEMTDFATLPDARGKKLSLILLKTMEGEMIKLGMKTLYTIARLNSFPMNRTFLANGYRYSGTLINNTNIAGQIESMNVLYKRLSYESV